MTSTSTLSAISALSAVRAPALTCRIVSNADEANSLHPAWTDLLERCERNELTQSSDWLLTWWRVFGPTQGRQLRLALFHAGDRLVGLVPLLRRRHWYRDWLPFTRLELLASGEPAEHGIYSNHIGILAERRQEANVARRLVEEIVAGALGRWDEVVLPMMSADSAMPELLVEAFGRAGCRAEMTIPTGAPYIPLPATWSEYLHGLSANSRRNIERSLKAFDKWAAGTTELECISTPAELERGKAILTSLHHERWSGSEARLSSLAEPATDALARQESLAPQGVFRSLLFLDFHDRVMRGLAERGALELLILRAHGEPVAALYSMIWAGKVTAYQTGRRIDVPANVRPGGVILSLAIRRAIEQGRREFDLQADEAFYKSQLTPHVRKLVQVRAARNSLPELIRKLGLRVRGKIT